MSYCWQVILTHTHKHACVLVHTLIRVPGAMSIKVTQLVPAPDIACNSKQSPRSSNLRFSRPRAITSHLKVGRPSPGHEAAPACKDKGHQFVDARHERHIIYDDNDVYVYFCQTWNLWKIFRLKWQYAIKFARTLFVVSRVLPNNAHEKEVWINNTDVLTI